VAEEFGVLEHEDIHSGEAFRQLLTGEMDGVILKLGRLEEWDIAAPAAVVRALGGSVVDIHGDEFRFGAGESSRVVIITPKHFQEELVDLARAFARDYSE
jgi:3'-phosphoadenosine 5'-phosphosulfate (PAPS) 3'-phosphatase